MYPQDMVEPMIDELTDLGFKELKTPGDVDDAMDNKEGTTLMVINSVCGCAAGSMRPAVKLSLDSDQKPNNLTTVFAGVDKEATERARQYLLPYPPSSPSIGLFKDGKLIHFLERHHIEGRPAEMIAENLKMAYQEYC